MNRLSPRARRVLLVVALAAGAYLAFCGVWLAMARREARTGSEQLARFRQDPDPRELLDGTALPVIRAARRDFASARDRARAPVLAPLRALPVVGRQIDAFAAISDAAAQVASHGVQGAAQARETLNGEITPGPARVARLRDLAEIAEMTSARIATVPLGPRDGLVGPVARARREFAAEKDRIELALLYTRDASRAVADLLDGPSSYLLLAGNNAEMRDGSGMFLSAGRVEFGAGRLQLSELESTGDLHLDVGVPYRDRDLEARWGFAHPNREWRNLALSPRFPPNAEMASRMWRAAGRPEVDGVLAIDLVGLQALLRATGPVVVAGETVDADNVLPLLMHDQYLGDFEQDARRDRLAEIARAVLQGFDQRAPDLPALAEAVQQAVAGRHLMLWSGAPDDQRAWEQAGVSGSVDPDELMLGVMTRGGDKLDQFQSVRARLATASAAGGTRVTVRVEVENGTPPGEPYYVAGDEPYGRYEGFLSLTMPEGARLLATSRSDAVAAGPDGTNEVIAVPVVIAAGDTVAWRVSFYLPDDRDALTVGPSARVPHLEWWGPDGLRWNDRDTPRQRVPLDP